MSLGNLVYPFRLVGRRGGEGGGQVGAGLSLGFTSNRVPGPSPRNSTNFIRVHFHFPSGTPVSSPLD